jgi:hypothetical protein
MQNKYFGDIHDFYKYYFLKEISECYSLGINWCLVPDEPKSNDGRKCPSDKEKNKDNELYLLLKDPPKNVEGIKKYFKKGTKFFSEMHRDFYLDYIYNKNAINKLIGCDIIFFDPDNGIEMPSTNNNNKFKFVSYGQLFDFWNIGKTLIIYQHSDRKKKSTETKIENLCKLLKCKEADIFVIKRGQVKYFVIINKEHYSLKKKITEFLNNNKEYEKYM